ncbi:probable inactive peptidyl-prolyl cis-trans isomerase-like 6 isoform X2 [Leptinotarsa decemlineata]|uniref:probable inactive peptidyl-prolyl cis-trans isomerase-like 6 isoform X2 n=1 Tax=Leptinotarsa decemlineata TaxID=7539 RepID=UPI003D30C744
MSDTSLCEPTEKFIVSGIVTSIEFQKSRFITTKLHRCFPKQYEEPDIRPMLDVEWDEYLMRKRRKYGKGLWSLRKPVMIFRNDEYLGDDADLWIQISKKFRFSLKMDWYEIGKCHFVYYLQEIMRKFRQLAYITISINHRVIGTMMFELYNDLVPFACENFLNKCKSRDDGYIGKPIQRILKNSWIQCGGWDLPEKHMRCENYVVPHDRRGVLCMCNNGRHTDNSTQFFITLAATPWMDYRYVAFGQLIQGSKILKQIEEVPTQCECPLYPISITMSGEVTFDNKPDFITTKELQEFQSRKSMTILDDLMEPKDKHMSFGSVFSQRKFGQGKYCLETDMRRYLPFVHLFEYFAPSDKLGKGGNIEGNETSQSELMKSPHVEPQDFYVPWTYKDSPSFSDITL